MSRRNTRRGRWRISLYVDIENAITIAHHGGIAAMIALLTSGTGLQKENAAAALGNIAMNYENGTAIADGDGIPPLIALVSRPGTPMQKENAAGTLANLSLNYENAIAIARGGGIPPLTALVTSGTDGQKQYAAHRRCTASLFTTEIKSSRSRR